MKKDRGALFKNRRKEKPSQPDYSGHLEVDGVKRRLAGWITESKNGSKYIGLALGEPIIDEKKSEPPPSDSDLEDVPF